VQSDIEEYDSPGSDSDGRVDDKPVKFQSAYLRSNIRHSKLFSYYYPLSFRIFSHVRVTIGRVWIGNQIYRTINSRAVAISDTLQFTTERI
jgi:hypothetical protein